ncbi:hsc70-interacting protein-like [Belonocnema kinseyi]|uniref:hsc70-interacting protein-like n=1 Tax=Belonocnema kinseyi TaxID=2817044 RepID=UPI00143D16A0|nr:hsc70-interacting protein-like [Belonocnema kinseyi]
MTHPFNPEQLTKMKAFTELCMKNPSILNIPDLAFIKNFIKHFGGVIPESRSESKPEEFKDNEPEVKPDAESEESDLELDMTGVLEQDNFCA